jgi:hypothetical protein
MEPEGSLPCSQEPSTGPYPEPDQSNTYQPILPLLAGCCSVGVQQESANANETELSYLPARDRTDYSTAVMWHLWASRRNMVRSFTFWKLHRSGFSVIALQATAVSSNKFFKGSLNPHAIFCYRSFCTNIVVIFCYCSFIRISFCVNVFKCNEISSPARFPCTEISLYNSWVQIREPGKERKMTGEIMEKAICIVEYIDKVDQYRAYYSVLRKAKKWSKLYTKPKM